MNVDRSCRGGGEGGGGGDQRGARWIAVTGNRTGLPTLGAPAHADTCFGITPQMTGKIGKEGFSAANETSKLAATRLRSDGRWDDVVPVRIEARSEIPRVTR